MFEHPRQKNNEKTLKSEFEDSGEICRNKMFDKMIKYIIKKQITDFKLVFTFVGTEKIIPKLKCFCVKII